MLSRQCNSKWAASSCLFFIVLFFAACAPATQTPEVEAPPVVRLKTGADVLHQSGFALFEGKTIGLVVNHTARVDSMHLGDLVEQAPNVKLGAFFSPEHGIRGDADAGEEIADGVDQKTGLPVHSLHGKERKPAQEDLVGLDALVFDIQDIGARFYTYISTMGYAMQAAAEAGIPFYVLDRPNPLGGNYVAGFVLEEAFSSFVGLYPVPVAHGLTVGELARMIKGEGYLDGLENLALHVVEMEGWDRTQKWPATGRTWRPTSPNIPDFTTAVAYIGTCFFEAVDASEGRGTRTPFTQVGASWLDAQVLVDSLEAAQLPGVAFSRASFTPESIADMSRNPRFEGELQQGVHIEITDLETFDPLETGMHLLAGFYAQALENDFVNKSWMGRLAGTDQLAELLEMQVPPAQIVDAWEEDVHQFTQARQPYLLY
ncbi:MAG: DUF1343 domain-containing protein [Bacteroidota bacterium]